MIPAGAKVLPLVEGTKVPTPGSRGHHDAIVWAQDGTPSGNYGIALDGNFIVVDFDRDDVCGWKPKLPETWHQKTPRGEHYLYSVPTGWRWEQQRNCRFPAGDVKVKGYIVGPGSAVAGASYVIADAREPTPAPSWLLDFIAAKTDVHESGTVDEADAKDTLGEGERNDSLVRMAGLMRRMGLAEGAIAVGLDAFNKSIVDPPLSLAEVRIIAKHAAKYGMVPGEMGPLNPEGWITADDISFVGPPTEYWVRYFVPKKELVMLWGKGGIGKSSWGSWLSTIVTNKGGRFAFAGVEEPFERFAARAVLGGAVPELLLRVPSASGLQLPRDAKALAQVLEVTQTDVLYFDSIYSHFHSVPGENTAERARKCLGPLAEIAQSSGKTIVAVFHENKMGQFLGSTEMENVARVTLRAKREQGKPLLVAVDKSNLRRPDYCMTFLGKEVAISDPHTGEIQYERLDDGTLIPDTLFVLERGQDVDTNSVDIDKIEQPLEERIEELLQMNPELSNREIAEMLEVSMSGVAHAAPTVRSTLALESKAVYAMQKV